MSKTKAQLESALKDSDTIISSWEKDYADLEKENEKLQAKFEEGLGGPDDIPEHGHAKHESKAKRQAHLQARKSQKPTIHELEAILEEE